MCPLRSTVSLSSSTLKALAFGLGQTMEIDTAS